jgi:hypothetical protein
MATIVTNEASCRARPLEMSARGAGKEMPASEATGRFEAELCWQPVVDVPLLYWPLGSMTFDERPPAVPLVVRATAGSALGGVAGYGLAVFARSALDLGAAYPFKVVALFLLMMAVALTGLRRHHPFRRFGPANRITTFRALLVSLVAGVVGESGRSDAAEAVALAAGVAALVATVLDGADGQAARRSGMESPFGARFDMEVDALLILVLAVLVAQFQKPWMGRPLLPSTRRQAVCVIQLCGLMLALAPFVPSPLSAQIAALSLAALAWSFWVDVHWLWQRREDLDSRP